MPFSYATPGHGPSAGGIGWFDFGALTLTLGQTITGLTGTLTGGEIATFGVTNVSVSGSPTNFVSSTVPIWSFAELGKPSLPLPTYATIAGQVAIVNTPVAAGH